MSASPTTRMAILQAFVTRLEAITQDNGFATNAGAAVVIGDIELGDDDADITIAVVPGDAPDRYQTNMPTVDWPIEVQALVKVGIDDAALTIEAMVGDIKRAIEIASDVKRTLGGLVKDISRGGTKTVQRQPGSLTGGVGVTYVPSFLEPWGQP